MTSILISAGDASGDLHGAEVVRALRCRDPQLQIFGLGGSAMEEAGVERVVDASALAVAGALEIARSAARIIDAWRTLAREQDARKPDLAVLIDSGGFHLPFARRLKRAGVPVLYYVAPQVWAWRTGRIRKLAGRVDRLAVILPFEVEVYEGSGVAAEFVGHPLVEPLRRVRESLDLDEARRKLDLREGARWIALMPGSRRNEIATLLPVQLEAARALHVQDPRLAFAIGVAPTIERAQVEALVRRAELPSLLEMRIVESDSRVLIRAADLVLAKPGTVTLEAALLERPLVVVGRAHAVTAAVLRRMLKVQHLAMPNLIAGRAIVPELMQRNATPEKIAMKVRELLGGPARDGQLRALAQVRERLGEGGAAERVARIAEEMLGSAAT